MGLYEHYNTGDDSWYTFGGVSWRAMTFKTGSEGHLVNVIKLKLADQTGADGATLTASIRAVDGSGHPTGADLTVGTLYPLSQVTHNSAGEWYEFPVTEYFLLPNTHYAIVLRSSSSGITNWRLATGGGYADGNSEASGDSGSTWAGYSPDMMFEIWWIIVTELSFTEYLTLSDQQVLPEEITGCWIQGFWVRKVRARLDKTLADDHNIPRAVLQMCRDILKERIF